MPRTGMTGSCGCHLTPVRMANTKRKKWQQMLERGWERKTLALPRWEYELGQPTWNSRQRFLKKLSLCFHYQWSSLKTEELNLENSGEKWSPFILSLFGCMFSPYLLSREHDLLLKECCRNRVQTGLTIRRSKFKSQPISTSVHTKNGIENNT